MRLKNIPEADCVFCKRIANNEYTRFDNLAAAFEPLNPVTPGHMLFISFMHTLDAMARPRIAGQLFTAAAEWGWSQDEDFNLITSNGSDATQTVPHLHVHYIPRRNGDGLYLPWTGQHTTPKEQ